MFRLSSQQRGVLVAAGGPMRNIPAADRGLAASLVAESRQTGAVLGVAVLGCIVAGYKVNGRTGASAAGLEAAMYTAAGACLVAAILVFALVPARTPAAAPTV
jgi:hypothetical protein